jgi:ring-1,2-phenylacetyl-CoA epoxidase subunit PaaE
MAKFFNLKISEKIQETKDAVSLSFDIPSELTETFKYKQGQYITFKLNVDGTELRRSYSICSNPFSNEMLKVAIKQTKNGWGSVYLNQKVNVGDALEVMAPMGGFYSELNSNNKKNYYLFAGGSGITPMLSIIKAVLSLEAHSKITLFYGNLNEESIIFRNELKQLSSDTRLTVIDILDQPANSSFPEELKGIMDKAMLVKLIEKYVDVTSDADYFICGPTPMMQNAESLLKERVEDKKRVHLEYFSTPDLPQEVVQTAVSTSPVNCSATVICDGDEKVIEIKAGKNILDVALDENIDAPYACQGGSCCTCRALLVEGKVQMKVNFALSEDEVKQGYILTCQSYPLTPNIVVDYDRGR